MNRLLLFPVTLAAALTFSACSKSDSGPAAPPDNPPGVAEAEPNDVEPQNLGVLGSTDLRVNGSAAGTADLDWFAVTLADTTNLHCSVDWGSGDLDLGAADSNGIMMTFRDTGAKPERCTLPVRTPGRYLIRVTSKTATAVAYTLIIGSR